MKAKYRLNPQELETEEMTHTSKTDSHVLTAPAGAQGAKETAQSHPNVAHSSSVLQILWPETVFSVCGFFSFFLFFLDQTLFCSCQLVSVLLENTSKYRFPHVYLVHSCEKRAVARQGSPCAESGRTFKKSWRKAGHEWLLREAEPDWLTIAMRRDRRKRGLRGHAGGGAP